MRSLTRLSLRHPLVVVILLATVTAVALAGLPRATTEVGYRVFLGEDHPAIRELDALIGDFAGGLPVYVAWECGLGFPCDTALDKPSLLMARSITDEVLRHPLVDSIQSPATAPIIVPSNDGIRVHRLVESGQVSAKLDELAKIVLNDPNWTGVLVSNDLRVGAMIVQLSSTDSSAASEVVGTIQEALLPYERQGFRYYLMGDPVDFVVSGGQMQEDTPLIVAILIVFLSLATWMLLRSWVGVLATVALAGLSVGWAMGFMAWMGWPEIELTQALRPGILFIAVCDAVHFLTRYATLADGARPSSRHERRQWLVKVSNDIWLPCALTSATTAAGFLSFLTSNMESFSRFGITAAIGIGTGLLLTFTLLPILVERLDHRRFTSVRGKAVWSIVLAQLTRTAENRPRAVLALSILVLIGSAFGLSRLRVDVDERELIGKDSDVVRWSMFIEENLRKPDSLEITLFAPETISLFEPEAAAVVASISERVTDINGLGGTRSYLDLLDYMDERLTDSTADAVPESPRSFQRNAELAFLIDLMDGDPLENWIRYERRARLSIEAETLASSDRVKVLASVEKVLADELPIGWRSTVSGPLPVYLEFADAIQRTQLASFLAAFGSVAILVALYLFASGLRGLNVFRWTGIAMFPTVLPVVSTLGVMGLLDVPLDVGTAMVGAIILGLAVDDSIHLISAIRTARSNGHSTRHAIAEAIQLTGQALITSSIAISVGCFALMASSWQSIASFGLLSGVAILGALVADLVILPAMLLSFSSAQRPPRGQDEPVVVSDLPKDRARVTSTLMSLTIACSAIGSILIVSDNTELTEASVAAAIVIGFSAIVGFAVTWLSSAQAAVPCGSLVASLAVVTMIRTIPIESNALRSLLVLCLSTALASALHLFMTFPRRSRLLQDIPSLVAVPYVVGGVAFVALALGEVRYPTISAYSSFVVVTLLAAVGLLTTFSLLHIRDDLDSIEKRRAKSATRSGLILLGGLASLPFMFPDSERALVIAIGTTSVFPIGFALIRYQYFDIASQAETLARRVAPRLAYLLLATLVCTWLINMSVDLSGTTTLWIGPIVLGVLICAELTRTLAMRFVAPPSQAAKTRLQLEEQAFARALSSINDEDSIFREVARTVATGTGADAVSVYATNDRQWRLVAGDGVVHDPQRTLDRAAQVADRYGQAVHLGPEGGALGSAADELRSVGVSIVSPVRWGEEQIGLVVVAQPATLLPFQQPAVDFVERVCLRAGASLHSARLTDQLVRAERYSTIEWVATGLMHSVGRPMAILRRSAERLERNELVRFHVGEFLDDAKLAADEALEGIRLLSDHAATGRSKHNRSLPLPEVVERAVRTASKLHHGREIVTRMASDLPAVPDAEEVRRVMVSILDNALHATGMSDPSPELRASAEYGALVVEVVDFGCGMDEATAARAVQPFFTTRRFDGGSGIGLADAKSTIERLGGALAIESQAGQGTRVRFRIVPQEPVEDEPTSSEYLQ